MSDTHAGNVLMKALLLTDEQVGRYGQMMQNLTDDEKNNISYEDYVQDCTARRESAVTSFTATRTGFTAQADLEAENLVLFSVPYDDGFTATVNGVPAEVEKVDNGLMAVAAPAGHSEIVFTYHTAGLRQSVAVSAGAIVVYAVWVAVLHRKKAPGREQCGVNDAPPNRWECARSKLGQHRIIPALRLKHRSGGCGTASALPKCSIIHKVLSALLAWHLPHLACRIGT